LQCEEQFDKLNHGVIAFFKSQVYEYVLLPNRKQVRDTSHI